MKESAKLELQDKYESEYKKTNRYVKEAQEEMRKKEYNLLKPIQEELQAVIGDYAKKNSIDYIFDKGYPGLLFSSEKMNISDEILKIYDEKFKQKPKGKK
ncbi:OmpH family outer membrane protein [bacterium]|nr:OmpH family outer membrane protein [bacterium]